VRHPVKIYMVTLKDSTGIPSDMKSARGIYIKAHRDKHSTIIPTRTSITTRARSVQCYEATGSLQAIFHVAGNRLPVLSFNVTIYIFTGSNISINDQFGFSVRASIWKDL
jgi:hypothetical protein